MTRERLEQHRLAQTRWYERYLALLADEGHTAATQFRLATAEDQPVKGRERPPQRNLLACCGAWVPITSVPFESPCCHVTYFVATKEGT
jgi:hypothetical protein